MLVEFSIGKESQKVVMSLKKSIDNVDFFTHINMPAFIKEAKSRKLVFQRIVITPAILSGKRVDKDFKELNNYIKKFSPSAEVVLFTIAGTRVETFEEFKKVFNSPQYVAVDLPKATIVSMSKMVTCSIEEIRSTWCPEESVESAELEPNSSSVEIGGQVGGDSGQTNIAESMESSIHQDAVNVGGSLSNEEDSTSEKNLDFGSISSISDSSSVAEDNIEDLVSNLSECDLSLGDFGKSHSDTGYLDDEGDEELQEFLKSKEVEEKQPVEEVKIKEQVVKEVITPEVKKDDLPNIDIVVAVKGSGSTQAIVDQAAKIVSQDEARVLLIDLDTRENGLLSFIDVNKFYMESAYQGISKQRVYTEDGIGVVSNGYGFNVKPKELKTLLNSKLLPSYDMVYIDCPAECLSSVDEDILKMCSNILVMSGTDLGDLVSTSLALTNRNVVSLPVERYIMGNCFVELHGTDNTSGIGYLRDTCVFANGSWLSRIGL